MIAGLLSRVALADPVETRSLVQARTDALGQVFFGGVEALDATAELGPARVEGAGDLGFPGGFDAGMDGALYLLAADGEAGALRWTLGRQPLLLPTWSRRLDGGTLAWDAGGRWSFGAALGLAGLPGQLRTRRGPGEFDGRPLARLDAGWARDSSPSGPERFGTRFIELVPLEPAVRPGGVQGAPPPAGVRGRSPPQMELRARAGVWGEAGARPVGHADVEAQLGGPGSAEVGLLGAVATRSGATAVERGRVQAGLMPVSGVRALGWIEHREGLPGASPLSPAILSTFAPDGSDGAGLAAGVSTANRARLWASGSVQRWSPLGGAVVTGVLGELRWEPSCGAERWCVGPAWQGAGSDRGAYHRAGAVVTVPLPTAAALDLEAAWVPYRQPHVDWRSAWVTGVRGAVVASPRLTLEAGADALLDAGPPVVRGWVAVRARAGTVP